jgi:hypothetical protein
MNKHIDSSQISVIVRGLIVGAGQPDEQKKFTKRSLLSVRKHLPDAQIILSSWNGSDVSGLEYDELVLSESPAEIYTMRADQTRKLMTVNNQLITVNGGLRKASRPYVLNMRSDIVLTGTKFIDYFLKFNQGTNEGILKKRVVVLPTYNPRRNTPFPFLFNVCDWFYFGLTEDVRNIFDVPFLRESDLHGQKRGEYFPHEENFEAEQHLWSNFLKKHQEVPLESPSFFSPEALAVSEKSYAQNTIMLPATKAGVICLKMPHAGYGARPFLSQGLYTFNEYKKMYNRYNQHKVFYIPNPAENIAYWLMLKLRFAMKHANPERYKKIVNFVRKLHGSQNFIAK